MSSPPSHSPVGIIAGRGQFPFLVARGAVKNDLPVFAAGFSGHTDPDLEHEVTGMSMLRLGQLEKLIKFFKNHGVRRIVFAGAIHKPSALQIRPDLRTIRLALRLRSRNDSALLGEVARELEKEGLVIESPLTFVPDLAMPEGVLTRRRPSRQEQEDISFGWPIAKDLGRLDIGQCLVVGNRMVVAVEAMEGTDAVLLRAGELLRKGGVVIKVFKPGQEKHIDQPSIGLVTIETMNRAGLSCLAVEAGSALFFDRAESLALADRKGICVVGITGQEFPDSSLQGREDTV